MNVLVINSSARTAASSSSQITATIADTLALSGASVSTRDLNADISYVNEDWIDAGQTDPAAWSVGMGTARSQSDSLIAEIKASDTLVIGAPLYNFGVPAVLKAWFDQICRAGETFKYTESGPVGLLQGKRAIVVITSGGVAADGPVDFATPGFARSSSSLALPMFKSSRLTSRSREKDRSRRRWPRPARSPSIHAFWGPSAPERAHLAPSNNA